MVAYGHGITSSPHHFDFDGICSAGWFVGCYSSETDDLLKKPHNIPGAVSRPDEYEFALDPCRYRKGEKNGWDMLWRMLNNYSQGCI